jgi:hypothetical protein
MFGPNITGGLVNSKNQYAIAADSQQKKVLNDPNDVKLRPYAKV